MTYVLWDVQSKLADHSLQNTHLMNSSIQGKKCDVEVFASFRSVASPLLKKEKNCRKQRFMSSRQKSIKQSTLRSIQYHHVASTLITFNFTPFSTVFQSYQGDGRMIVISRLQFCLPAQSGSKLFWNVAYGSKTEVTIVVPLYAKRGESGKKHGGDPYIL